MPLKTQRERLAMVEARLDVLVPTIHEIRGDVKALLATHNSQRGALKLLTLLWAGALSFCGFMVGRGQG